MKKFFNSTVMMMLAMMVAAVNFTACSNDEEEDGGGKTDSNYATLKINGTNWVSSTTNPPKFYGHFDGSQSAGLIFAKFTRKEVSDMQLILSPDALTFDISMKPNFSITKGLDLVTSNDVARASGNTEFTLSEGILGEDDYRCGAYNTNGATGSAIVADFKENDYFTIEFTNFTMKLIEDKSTDNADKTLTIDGTVTFKYTDSLNEVSF